jgi:acyl-CoA synthetase (AMP-forming)/AMP-acid ligase II
MANIARYFFKRAKSHPQALALSFEGRSLPYAELGQRVSQLAGGLRQVLALQPGERVVLCMENRPEFIELLLACWCAGLSAVPVNSKLHPKEIAHIADDSGARAVFTSEALYPAMSDMVAAPTAGAPHASAPNPPQKPEVVAVQHDRYRQLLQAPTLPCADTQADELAWIFYTSGTTGKPKGAMLSHRNLLAMSQAYYADIERVEPGDTMLHAAPLSHGSGLYAIPHLLAGGHQVVLGGFEPEAVLQAFADYRNVATFAAPTMVSRLLQHPGIDAEHTGLRTIIYGGAPMYLSDLRKALDVFGPRLFHLYGQGESPMTISGLSAREHEGDGGAEHLGRLSSCGAARSGVEVRVVNGVGDDLAPGELGEVITRSDCVMRGYWNNPAATSAALRQGWLWTGDVGFLDEQGYLHLRDRSKDLIISGGSNIYPREIEEVLLTHPAVLECSVVGRPHADWGEEVVAFVVQRNGQAVDADTLDAMCLSNIARFKRPKAYHFVESLPKNNYGKVLKTELRKRA